MLAWFHAVVQERLRYTPLGWAKKYEWSEADFRVACDTLDACVDMTAMVLTSRRSTEKANRRVAPTKLDRSTCSYLGTIESAARQGSVERDAHATVAVHLRRAYRQRIRSSARGRLLVAAPFRYAIGCHWHRLASVLLLQVLLDCFIEKLFTASSFDADCTLIGNLDGKGSRLLMPDGVRREQFVQWTDSIKHLQAPIWLGLPNNAEKVLLTNRG